MPSVSEKQRRYLGMQLAKKRAGKRMDVQMSEAQLRHFAGNPVMKRFRHGRGR